MNDARAHATPARSKKETNKLSTIDKLQTSLEST